MTPLCRLGIHARTVWKPAKKHDILQYGHCPRCGAAQSREVGDRRGIVLLVLFALCILCGVAAFWTGVVS